MRSRRGGGRSQTEEEPMEVLTVILLVLAIWRGTRLLVVDQWPPTAWLRDWMCYTFAVVESDGQIVRRTQQNVWRFAWLLGLSSPAIMGVAIWLHGSRWDVWDVIAAAVSLTVGVL